MIDRCPPCLRTPVHHVSGLYTALYPRLYSAARIRGLNGLAVFFITAHCDAFVQLSESSLKRTSEIISSLNRNCDFLKSSDTCRINGRSACVSIRPDV